MSRRDHLGERVLWVCYNHFIELGDLNSLCCIEMRFGRIVKEIIQSSTGKQEFTSNGEIFAKCAVMPRLFRLRFPTKIGLEARSMLVCVSSLSTFMGTHELFGTLCFWVFFLVDCCISSLQGRTLLQQRSLWSHCKSSLYQRCIVTKLTLGSENIYFRPVLRFGALGSCLTNAPLARLHLPRWARWTNET